MNKEMSSDKSRWILVAVLGGVLLTLSWSQSSGSRGGISAAPHQAWTSGMPASLVDRELLEGVITLEGRAQVRVQPTEIRVVLAVTSAGKSASECARLNLATRTAFLEALAELGVPAEARAVDFISLLPVYEWATRTVESREVAVEEKTGHRMQYNIHFAVAREDQAQQAIARAFELGITDVIAFDYWNPDLNATKLLAREKALLAAKAKSELLFDSLFAYDPPVVNIEEHTEVVYPESLYQSFENSYRQAYRRPVRDDIPQIHAFRPKNTYYRGMFADVDVQSEQLPLRPAISVIASVRLHFRGR